MEGILLKIILLFAVTVTGEPPAMYQAQPIKAAEGDDVTLQCRLDPPVNLSAFTVDWTRLDNKDIVHVYRHQQDDPDPQTDQYRGRTTLLHEDLIRGVLTLHISSVKLSDRGLYKGFVPKLKTSCVVDLIVETVGKDQQNETKRDDSSTTGSPEEEETEPDGRGGGNKIAGRAGIISSVILCVVVVVLLLRKNGTIRKLQHFISMVFQGLTQQTQNNRSRQLETREEKFKFFSRGSGCFDESDIVTVSS